MKTENFFDSQIKFSYAKFAATTNKCDPSDVIDLKNLNFKAYQKRVGNLILEIIYENSNKKITLPQFIKDSWATNQYPIGGFIVSVEGTENNSIDLQEGQSPPFLLSNTSFNEDLFQLKNIPMPDELEISEIKSLDDYLHGSSIGKSEINFAFDETSSLHKIEEYPQIMVKPPIEERKKEENEHEIQTRRNQKKRRTQKEEEWLSKNVIKEASNSEISDSNNFSNKDESFLPISNANKQNIEIKSITGIKSHIKKNSYSESSDFECQKNSFFNQLVKKTEEEEKISDKTVEKKNLDESSDNPIKVEESLEIMPEPQEKHPWFTLSIIGQEKKFKDLFISFSTTGELVSLASLQILFEKTLKALKIEPFDHYREIFKSIYEDAYTKKPNKSALTKAGASNIKLNFQEFTKIMDMWGEKYQQEQKTVLGSVIRTSSHLNTLQNTYNHLEPLANIIDFTVIKLKECINDYVHMQKSVKIAEDVQKKNLENIFLFYGKIQKIQGSEPTFEALELSNTAWNLGKFLKFCSDFKIIAVKNAKQRAATKETLTLIFKKTANYTRIMFFPQFIAALDRIAEILYSLELDKILDSNFALKPLSVKRDLLYSLLEISNFAKIQMKKKPFGTGFSPDKFSRIPKSDPSHKYKFNPNSQVLKNIENWKKVRREPQIIEEPIVNKFKILSPQPVLKKNLRFGQEGGYSRKAKVGYEGILKYDSQVNFDGGLQSVVKSRSPEVVSNKMTIKSLYNLNYEDLDDEFELRGLIGNESDEFVDKIYNVDHRLGRILKMQDDRLARSQKVLEKNKYR